MNTMPRDSDKIARSSFSTPWQARVNCLLFTYTGAETITGQQRARKQSHVGASRVIVAAYAGNARHTARHSSRAVEVALHYTAEEHRIDVLVVVAGRSAHQTTQKQLSNARDETDGPRVTAARLSVTLAPRMPRVVRTKSSQYVRAQKYAIAQRVQ